MALFKAVQNLGKSNRSKESWSFGQLPVEIRLLVFKATFMTTSAEIDNEGRIHHFLLNPVFALFHAEIYDSMFHSGAPILLSTSHWLHALWRAPHSPYNSPVQYQHYQRFGQSCKKPRIMIQLIHSSYCFWCTLQKRTRNWRRWFRFISTCDVCEQDMRFMRDALRWYARAVVSDHIEFLEPERKAWSVPWKEVLDECTFGTAMIGVSRALLLLWRAPIDHRHELPRKLLEVLWMTNVVMLGFKTLSLTAVDRRSR